MIHHRYCRLGVSLSPNEEASDKKSDKKRDKMSDKKPFTCFYVVICKNNMNLA